MRTLGSVFVMVAACGGSAKQPAPAKPVANHAQPEVDPQTAREQAIEAARNAGVLGTLSCGGSAYGGSAYGGSTYGFGCGGGFATLTSTGELGSALDDANVYGGLLGDEDGEMNGGFGYGKAGFGAGGGGADWAGASGGLGTIGHGSGTGTGYGVGSGGGTTGTSGTAGPTVKIGSPSATGDLDKAIIRRYIRRNIQKITYCYEKGLLDKPALAGTVHASFTIAADGKVTVSTAGGVDPDVASCVAAVIAAIEFPAPRSGGVVNVKYPFTFRPESKPTTK